jgi:DNA-directed RNA polymerase alpha subunit
MAHHRGNNWTPEDDRRLLDLIAAGKSWVLISANLKRSEKSVRVRANYLRRQAKTLSTDQRRTQEQIELRYARPDKIELSSGHLLDPFPELPDDTRIDRVRFPTRIYNLLVAADVKTIGEIRMMSDAELQTFQDCGAGTISYLRKTLGLPSTDGVRPR